MVATGSIRVLILGEDTDPVIAQLDGASPLSIGRSTTLIGAIRQLETDRIDCVVIGPSIDATEVVPILDRLSDIRPSVPIVVVGDPNHPDQVIDALNAGANRYIRRSDPGADVLGSVVNIATQERVNASLDRHRELNEVIWTATEAVITADDRVELEAILHTTLIEADLVDSVWLGLPRDDDQYFELNQPFTTDLTRSQTRALMGEGAPEAIDRSIDKGTVGTYAVGAKGNGKASEIRCVVPFVTDHRVLGVLILGFRDMVELDEADRSALERFGRVICRVLAVVEGVLKPGERLDAVIRLVGHEIRNPLTVAMSSLQLARESREPSTLDRAERSLEEIERTISTFTTLFSGGELEQYPREFEETVTRAWETTATPTANLELQPVGVITAHHDLLERLLANLFRNAIQYGPPDVTIRVGPTDEGVFVADDGPGISQAEREQVFGWGYTEENTGTGLGLALVKEIVDLHGWSIDLVESQSGGARFEISGPTLITAGGEEGGSQPLNDR